MLRPAKRGKRKKPAQRSPRWSKVRVEALIEEATVDAYGESEQATGFFTMMEDHLRLPFETEILGASVSVERIDISDDDEIVALCRRGRERLTLQLDKLPLPSPPPQGSEWIAAYCYWRRGYR